jgi:hypothetical protein
VTVRSQDITHDPSAAVSPNIFDVLCNSTLIAPILLANLLSADLWLLSEKIRSKYSPPKGALEPAPALIPAVAVGDEGLSKTLREIQRQVDRGFKHVHPTEIAEIYGYLDIQTERRRLGHEQLNYMLGKIQRALKDRAALGEQQAARTTLLLNDLLHERFPAYIYQNYDLVHAHRKFRGHGSRAPDGLTSCLDETTIFIALVLALNPDDVSGIAILSSQTHYSAFGYGPNNEAWWFYGKNRLYSKKQWRLMVDENFSGDAQRCFDALFADFNKITTAAGAFEFDTGQCSIAIADLQQYLERIDDFFGTRLQQLAQGLSHPRQPATESPFSTILRQTLSIQARADVEQLVERLPDPLLNSVRYAYRAWNVPDRTPYLQAARRNPLTIKLASQLEDVSAALLRLQDIKKIESIFNDRERVALPDETLRLESGTDRDKALLLHVLLEHISQRDTQTPAVVKSAYGLDNSWVFYQDICYQLSDVKSVKAPLPSAVIFSL